MSADTATPGHRIQLVIRNDEPEPYHAFTTNRDANPVFLAVEGKDGTGELVPYPRLLSIAYAVLPGDEWVITLTTPVSLVLLEGRHLGELLRRLQITEVSIIREYDPQRWPLPEEGEACIARLTRHAPTPA